MRANAHMSESKKRPGLKPGQRHTGSFQKGVDPRRRGYVHDGKTFAAMAREEAPQCLALWVRAVADEAAPWPVRLRASELIVERAHGKAVSLIDMQVTHSRPLESMTVEELEAIAAGTDQAPSAPLQLDGPAQHITLAPTATERAPDVT
jgi:hypothetical protein